MTMRTMFTKMRAAVSLLFLFAASAGSAQGYYSYQPGDYTAKGITGGYKVTSVPNITMTYGGQIKSEGSSAPVDLNPYFKSYTNGANTPRFTDADGKVVSTYTVDNKLVPDSGTYYKFEPMKDGKLTFYANMNSGRKLFICKAESPTSCFPVAEYPDGYTTTAKESRAYTFSVSAGQVYYVFGVSTSASLLGFIYTTEVIDENAAYNAALAGQTAFMLNRTMEPDRWNTVCFPFDLSGNDCKYLFGDGYSIANYDTQASSENVFSFKSATTYTAGRPVLVKPTKVLSSAVLIAKLREVAAEQRGNKDCGYYVGTFEPFSAKITDTNLWFLTADNAVTQASQSGSIKGFRAYFKTVGETAAMPTLVIDGVTTGLVPVFDEAGTSVMEDASVFNLQGQRVADGLSGVQSLPKGIYVVMGRKFIRR